MHSQLVNQLSRRLYCALAAALEAIVHILKLMFPGKFSSAFAPHTLRSQQLQRTFHRVYEVCADIPAWNGHMPCTGRVAVRRGRGQLGGCTKQEAHMQVIGIMADESKVSTCTVQILEVCSVHILDVKVGLNNIVTSSFQNQQRSYN